MRFSALMVLLCLPVAAFAANPREAGEKGGMPRAEPKEANVILSFDTMYGVEGAYLGGGRNIRGVPGDKLPWELNSVNGTLFSDGRLVIDVKGLVFPNREPVPRELRGRNDDPMFRGAVSCLVEDEETGRVRVDNLVTKGFEANAKGDARIDEKLELPSECIAPVVMILAGEEMKTYAISGAKIH